MGKSFWPIHVPNGISIPSVLRKNAIRDSCVCSDSLVARNLPVVRRFKVNYLLLEKNRSIFADGHDSLLVSSFYEGMIVVGVIESGNPGGGVATSLGFGRDGPEGVEPSSGPYKSRRAGMAVEL